MQVAPVLRRALVIPLLLLLPVAFASSISWTDPVGDPQWSMYPVTPVPGLTCRDDRVDITRVDATADDDWITFTYTFVDRAAEPHCRIHATGTEMPLDAGRVSLEVRFGEMWGNPSLFIRSFGTDWCLSEFNIGSWWGQPDCELSSSDDTMTLRIRTLGWAIHDQTGEDVEAFDVRTLDWPAGRAYARATDTMQPIGRAVSFVDEVDLGIYDP